MPVRNRKESLRSGWAILRGALRTAKVRSAHLVLLVAFAGMQPLEAFCTSSSLTVFSNRFDGDNSLAGLLLSLCRNIRYSNKIIRVTAAKVRHP